MALDRLSIEGKVALITGAGSGIGLGVAKVFGEHGAKIGLLDQRADRVESAGAELEKLGIEYEPIVIDVTQADQVETAIAGLVDRFGRLDIVHANAGINGVWAPIEDITPEDFDRTLAVNLRGSFLTIKYAVPHIKRQGGGSVLLTSSVNGTRTFSNTGATAYSTSKAGQVAMAKMLAVELGPFNIRVNTICPGYYPSNIHETTHMKNREGLRRMPRDPFGSRPLDSDASPEQIGDLALFLVSQMGSHITGEVVYIDAGTSLVIG